jgi:uncharacterized membrane protein
MTILVVLIVGLLIAAPIIAIVAYIRVQDLSAKLNSTNVQDLMLRLNSLEQRLSALEKKLAAAIAPMPQHPVSGPTAEPPSLQPRGPSGLAPSPPPATVPVISPNPPPTQSRRDLPTSSFTKPAISPAQSVASDGLENLIGGHWLNRIGILAVFIGVSFFLKYAFDNNWIGPSGRIAIGILLGMLMLPWSHWLLGRGYPYFSEGIAALGQAILLLSFWAGCRYYTVFSREVGFAGMVLVTVTIAAVALSRDSQRIAMLSMLGGFLTPLLLSTGKDEQFALFTYILILCGGLLIMAWRRDWLWLAPVSFVLTQFYFWGWYIAFYQSTKLEATLAFATLFLLIYSTLPVLYSIRSGALDSLGSFLVVLNAFNYFAAAYAMLWPQHRWALTLLVLALSAAHLTVTVFLPAPKPASKDDEQQLARLVFGGLALTFATLAIPIRLDGKWITLAFAIEGAVLIWTGFRSLNLRLRQAGYFLLALAAVRVLLFPVSASQFLFNERVATYLVLIACMVAALLAARQHAATVGEQETSVLAVLSVAANAYALIALSLELWDYFDRGGVMGVDAHLAQHLALSLLWTGYASVLILAGVKRQSALLRWQALVLFGLAVAKVFLYDISYLDRFYRIVSFLILGVLLLVVSFLYQKKISRERPSP